jgi:hypothetical protein
LTNIARNIRTNASRPNTSVSVKLEFSNNVIEEYKMLISSFTLTSDRINPTIANVELVITD